MGSLLDEARAQVARREFALAAATLEQQLAQDPADLDALTLLAAVCVDTRRFDEAAAVLDRLHGHAIAQLVQQPEASAGEQAAYLAACLRGRVAEQRGDEAGATRAYALALAMRAHEPMPAAAFQRAGAASGRLAEYRQPADVAFVTGPLFGDPPFDGETPNRRALGGSESAVVAVARELAWLGLRVTVYCPCERPETYDDVVYRSNHDFAACLLVTPPSVVVASRYDGYLRAATATRARVLWLHDVADVPFYQHFDPVRAGVTQVVCLTEYHAINWRARLNAVADRIALLPNGFDPALFFPRPGTRRRQLIYASRPSRGLAVCLRTFAALRRREPGLELVVCSYAPRAQIEDLRDDPECADFATRLDAPGVRVVGGLTKAALAAELQQSLGMLYPNTSGLETSCIAVIEAMACGCPVVTSDRGAVPETLGGGAGGLIVPYTSDVEVLADRLEAATWPLLTDAQQWQAWSARVAAFASTRYPWPLVARQWHALIEPYLSTAAVHA